MNLAIPMRLLLLISSLSMVNGCAGQHPSRIVQLCLGDKQNIAVFKDVMQSIAQARGMEFVDGSARTGNDLATLDKHPGYELVHVGIRGKDGVGLEAGNLGLSAYEVAIGFSEGQNQAGAHQFEDAVIDALDDRWKVHAVPAGRGAFSLETCRGRDG